MGDLSNGAWITEIPSDYGTKYFVKTSFPKTLYDNATGTAGTVTLNESVSNYAYIEIYYRNNRDGGDRRYGFVKVYTPNGKIVSIPLIQTWDNKNMDIRGKDVLISDTSIAVKSSAYKSFTSSGTISEAGNYIYITKVVGYR